jgi:hypothetical protein
MLDILITNYWFRGVAAERHIVVTEAELQRALHAIFPSEAALDKQLMLTGESRADEEFILTGDLLSQKIRESLLGEVKPAATSRVREQTAVKLYGELGAAWTARTSCRAGYIVPECAQYRGARAPIL